MMKLAMSPAAATIMRSLIFRSGAEKNRILLIDAQSIDWQSLTFAGERHRLIIRVAGSDASSVADRICAGLEEAELSTAGTIVADIEVQGRTAAADGSVELTFSALTVAND